MIESTFAFFGIIIFLLLAYGAFAKVRLYSILGSLFLLVFGLFILIDGVQLKTGETTLTTGLSYEDCNCTEYEIRGQTYIFGKATVYALNETTTYNYATPTQISVFEWSNILSLIFILAGISGMYIYALQD